MTGFLGKMLRKRKYGENIIIVSGLPRSGTSMVMKMLEAGAIPIMTDHVRTADEDNPKGYYEYERVKDLDKDRDCSWLREARGKAIKIISFFLPHLPDENFYKIIFIHRDLDEVLISQNKMLERRGESGGDASDDKMKDNYTQHLRKLKALVFNSKNLEVLEINHGDVLSRPVETARKIKAFLGLSRSAEELGAVVDPKLYRSKAT